MISVSARPRPAEPSFGAELASAFGHGGSVRDGNFFFKPLPKAPDRYENEKRLLNLLGRRTDPAATDPTRAVDAEGGAGPSDPMASFVPRYFGEVQLERGGWYFKMEDLLSSFSQSHIADIKMGVRCISEDELHNEKPRPDLFDRMERLEAMLGEPVCRSTSCTFGPVCAGSSEYLVALRLLPSCCPGVLPNGCLLAGGRRGVSSQPYHSMRHMHPCSVLVTFPCSSPPGTDRCRTTGAYNDERAMDVTARHALFYSRAW
eukprot:scaffold176179_cov33-Tisochrysis_lutea.AAC.1